MLLQLATRECRVCYSVHFLRPNASDIQIEGKVEWKKCIIWNRRFGNDCTSNI